jgi:secreted PhoX family phosphatase
VSSSPQISRRALLGGAGALLVAACSGSGNDEGGDRSTRTGTTTTDTDRRTAPPLSTNPDANGFLLPEGFSSAVLATSGEVVGPSGYTWGPNPDGAATFPDPEVRGGWYAAVNHETLPGAGGGASALRFDPDGEIVDAYRILGDTTLNCAGGGTPWGTWLSCEEIERGRVFECDPTTPDSGRDLPALGRFYHEAVAVEPNGRHLYLTEDRPDGLFYRFTPARWPDLGAGVLEAARVDGDGAVTWIEAPDPSAATTPIRRQGLDATPFNGGEGIATGPTSDGTRVWFTTKGDNVVHELDPEASSLRELYRAAPGSNLTGVDNLWWDERSDVLFVAEDGGDMELIALDRAGSTAPLLRVLGHEGSEISGPTMNPRGTTLQFSSQRGRAGTNRGITYAITGPFAPAASGGRTRSPGS